MSRPGPALLCTADGEVFRGRLAGAAGPATGEAVFNTAMSGYQEIITDPSYAGQVVVMTAPHIGNYGVSQQDEQSGRPHLGGLVMRSLSRRDSNWRSEGALSGYLVENAIPAISEIDTRRLTRHIRDRGAMPVAMGADIDESELRDLAAGAPTMTGLDLASGVSTDEAYHVAAEGERKGLVVAIDLGMKREIAARLAGRGYDITVVPSRTTAEEILGLGPDGIFLSNGPGDPEPLTGVIATLRGLIGKLPLFGICLGHQVLGLAAGASTFKMGFGHHGANHPVQRLADGKVDITSQNHGFAVDLWPMAGTAPPAREGLAVRGRLPDQVDSAYGPLVPTHQNLNDGSLEGMALPDAAAFSVQYHPEAAPGPRDAVNLFEQFTAMIEGAA